MGRRWTKVETSLFFSIFLNMVTSYRYQGFCIMAEGKFEVYQDKAGEYRFKLKAPNGEIIATSEGYSSKTSCMNGIQSVMKNAPKAKIVEIKE